MSDELSDDARWLIGWFAADNELDRLGRLIEMEANRRGVTVARAKPNYPINDGGGRKFPIDVIKVKGAGK